MSSPRAQLRDFLVARFQTEGTLMRFVSDHFEEVVPDVSDKSLRTLADTFIRALIDHGRIPELWPPLLAARDQYADEIERLKADYVDYLTKYDGKPSPQIEALNPAVSAPAKEGDARRQHGAAAPVQTSLPDDGVPMARRGTARSTSPAARSLSMRRIPWWVMLFGAFGISGIAAQFVLDAATKQQAETGQNGDRPQSNETETRHPRDVGAPQLSSEEDSSLSEMVAPVADVGEPGLRAPEPPPVPVAVPDRPLRITTWNLEHMMSEGVFADWVDACALHDWDDDAARAHGKPPTLTYCNAHSGMDWPCADRQEALPLRTPEAFARKVEALRSRAAELDADIYAFQEVSDAEAVARILPPDTYEIFFAPAEIAMNVAFAFRRELAPAVSVEPLESLSVCAVADRLYPADPASCIEGSWRTPPGLVLNLRAGERTLSLLNVHLKSSCRGHPVSAPPLKQLAASACRAPDFDQDSANETYRAAVAKSCGLLRDQVPAVEGWIEAQARADRDFMVLGDFNRDFLRELREGMPARLDGTAARDPILPETAIGSILEEWRDNEPEGTDLYLVRHDIDGRDRTCRGEDGRTYGVPTCHNGIDHFLIGKQWAEAVSEDPRNLRASGRDYGDAGYCAEHARPSDHCPVTLEIRVPGSRPPPPTPPDTLSGEPLRAWLREHWYQGRHRTLGYNSARRAMYSHIDVAADGRVYGVYSGFSQPARETTFLDPINAEHTVPQSFFGRSDPMLSDIHHLFPTHKDVNSARGTDPFGEIPTTRWYGLTPGGTLVHGSPSASDRDAISEDRPDMFRPRGAHKGDAARAVFYFYTMYPWQAGPLARVVKGDLTVLGDWHRLDPPAAWERQRNDRIEAVQGNRNPYIDHPDLVCRAWGLGCP